MGFFLGIEVTRACNFSCRHCFVEAGRGHGTDRGLDRPTIEGLLGDAFILGVDQVAWSGGEPLLRRDLDELTHRAASLGLHVGLATNGYLATEKRLRSLRDAGLSVIQVSLDGPDPERAGRYRRGPRRCFERAEEAVRASVELGLQAWVCALLSPESLAEVEPMAALASALRADGLRYTIWTPVGRAHGERYDEAAWRGADLLHFLRVLEQHADDPSALPLIVDCPTGPMPWSKRHACSAGRETAYITASGDLYPCTALMTPDFLVGNVTRTPLPLLLSDGRMQRPLRALARRPAGGACAPCPLLATCRGGCLGRTLADAGTLGRGPVRGAMPVCFYRLASEMQGLAPSSEPDDPEPRS